MSLVHWGGPPYPSCECGHDRMAHTGMHGTDNTAARSEVMAGQRLNGVREFECSAVVGSGRCRCSQFKAKAGVAA